MSSSVSGSRYPYCMHKKYQLMTDTAASNDSRGPVTIHTHLFNRQLLNWENAEMCNYTFAYKYESSYHTN